MDADNDNDQHYYIMMIVIMNDGDDDETAAVVSLSLPFNVYVSCYSRASFYILCSWRDYVYTKLLNKR
jgi:hypothetical protein